MSTMSTIPTIQMNHNHSEQLYQDATKFIPGGVNSPVRAFAGVGGTPIFIKSAKGAYLTDVDDNQYIDYVGSWGPMILGHNHPAILQAVIATAQNGLSFGAPTSAEIDMAKFVQKLVPSMAQMRMVNSGTEATMSAIRLARGYTGRDKIIKFQGCYHGHADCLLVNAGSGLLTLGQPMGQPSSPGVPADFAKHTLTCQYNNVDSVAKMFEQFKDDIACVIVEPVAGNMNCIPPVAGFLQGLRDLCDQYKAVLIFDEVMTGFRVSLGGAQQRYQVTPDLTTLGKIIGGGMPVGAFGGRLEIMRYLAPVGPVYQAGTLSGNPLAMAAGLACLKVLACDHNSEKIEQATTKLLAGLKASAHKYGIPLYLTQAGAMFGFYFTEQTSIHNYEDVAKCDVDRFKKFFHLMLNQGVYLAPSAFEASFVSLAHTDEVIVKTIAAADKAFAQLIE